MMIPTPHRWSAIARSGMGTICLALACLAGGIARADAAYQSESILSVNAVAYVGVDAPPQVNPLCTNVVLGAKVSFPVLTVNPIGKISGSDPSLVVTGDASALGCVQEITFLYKKTFDSNVNVLISTFPADVVSSTFQFTVPSELVTSEGVMVQVKTVDASSNTVSWPATGYALVEVSGFAEATIGEEGGALMVPNPFGRNAGTGLIFPPGALTGNTKVTAREIDPLSIPNSLCAAFNGVTPVSVYEFKPSGTVFKRPVTLNMLYPDRDKDGVIDGTDKDQKLAQIFLCTDTGWQPLTGTVKIDTKIVSTRLLHFSIYGVIPAIPLLPEDYRPVQRVITPGNADGRNDQAVFGYMGPDMRIEIMDATGQRVRTLQNTTIWDGRDDRGKIVESGVYIYQYVKDGKRISGAIAVAK